MSVKSHAHISCVPEAFNVFQPPYISDICCRSDRNFFFSFHKGYYISVVERNTLKAGVLFMRFGCPQQRLALSVDVRIVYLEASTNIGTKK